MDTVFSTPPTGIKEETHGKINGLKEGRKKEARQDGQRKKESQTGKEKGEIGSLRIIGSHGREKLLHGGP